MTSAYDPSIKKLGVVDLNTDTGTLRYHSVESDANDNFVTKPRWWDYYAGMYNYYHVRAARWHVLIENFKTEPIWCHYFYCNDTLPPHGATNEDIINWRDAHSHYIGPYASGVNNLGEAINQQLNKNTLNIESGGASGNNANFSAGDMIDGVGPSPILKLSGSYRPGDFKRQIHLDAEVENWTAVNANPSLAERLILRFKPCWNGQALTGTGTFDRTLTFKVRTEIEYLVEFKELKEGLRWPLQRQPITVTIQQDKFVDEDNDQ
jgi:hypothetical protein